MSVLAGDIGGTKTILAIFSTEGGPRNPLVCKTYSSQQYRSLESVIECFLHETGARVERACLGVAGPVMQGRVHLTNLGWFLDAKEICTHFGLTEVYLLNDMQALGYSIPVLERASLATLSEGKPVLGGAIALLAPGTGLGEGFLTWDNGFYRAHPSEGSHAAFAPIGELQIGLLRYMNAQGFEHVSFERVCSGGLGIPNLYSYLRSIGYEEPDYLRKKLATADHPTPVLLEAALDESNPCEIAVKTMELFVEILGSEAGNLALKVLATGGIYLGGGISPRILPYLRRPAFLAALRNKGRFRETLTDVPVHVILDPQAGLWGAAAYGLQMVQMDSL